MRFTDDCAPHSARPNPRKTAFQVLFIVALVSLGGGYLALFSGKPKEADSMAEHSSYHAGELVTIVSGFGTPARACTEECSPWTCTSV